MNRRGELTVNALLVCALVLAFSGGVLNWVEWATGTATCGPVFQVALACFCMLWAVYLEVYSHRG